MDAMYDHYQPNRLRKTGMMTPKERITTPTYTLETPLLHLLMAMFMFTYAYKCLLYRLARQQGLNYS